MLPTCFDRGFAVSGRGSLPPRYDDARDIMTLASGSRLGPYEILSPLGAGGMGEVYRARDMRLGREVAAKTAPISVLMSWPSLAE